MKMILTFTSSDYSHWSPFIQIGIVSLILLVSNVIRRKTKLFRTLLFPTAIIGGFIGLGVKYILWGLNVKVGGDYVLTNSFLEAITYHAIALGFIAMGLKTVKKKDTDEIKGRPFKTGLIIVNTYLLQGFIGVSLTLLISYFFTRIPNYSGLLLPLGFGQGPGQAGNTGGMFESHGFIGGKTFGLAIATIGTLWACIVGVFYINRRAKEGKVLKQEERTQKDTTSEVIEDFDEIPASEAIDKMSIQIIFIIVIYFISYLFMKGITTLITIKEFTSLVWGFNFVFGMLFAMLFKVVIKGLRKKKLMNRQYTNNYLLNRITGAVFDFMIVASIMAIDVSMLSNHELWITLLVISTIAGLVTYFYLKYTVYKIYPDYKYEMFATLFGNLTGTASNGIALLREVDPDFETPAADDLVTGSSAAVLFGAPLLAIIGFIYLPEWYYFWGSYIGLLFFFILFSFFLYKEKKEPTNNKNELTEGVE